jgi:hypothetical protein
MAEDVARQDNKGLILINKPDPQTPESCDDEISGEDGPKTWMITVKVACLPRRPHLGCATRPLQPCYTRLGEGQEEGR